MAGDPGTEAAVRVGARGFTFDVFAGGPAGGEPILLLHGFPQHSAEWDLVIPHLHAAGMRTFALDQRGYSAGARPSGAAAYTLEELVADAVAVLDALGLASAHVCGHDWGAFVAWALAGAHPDRVRSLTAVSVPHPAAMAWALRHDRDQRRRSSYILLFRRRFLAEAVLLAFRGRALRKMLIGKRADRYVSRMRRPGALTAALNWYRAPITMRTGPIEVPTTLVWSDGDPALGRAGAERTARYVRADYRFAELTGVDHWVPERVPDRLADEILARAGIVAG
ncbi:pimeloyl-ACP methyl ester carboxylesterase [Catenuloplanes nepalensis]|uniref:Pimeloyl-ACP methyl ester carboxylesterase n=1 Tax=Catenuloplanes nepalensis TaxID=587533 RepID=A0ABT9MJJ7_9ACTN|nr:alpha/beta fold hydrolase [Catenuloplanes nepalensis]MDP9791582.1 pimeloyl-ACP methyl ester carboxylesterase [Catenuloplanes nepalensis]